ncbi:MAG: phosphoadenylyl-sulfate reductase, partial [Trinickia sp.]
MSATVVNPAELAGRADSAELAAKVERLNALIDTIAARHDGKVKLASSLAAEDMVLTHAILSRGAA